MAQRILGLDIGSSSIKALVLEAGLRRFEVAALHEVELPEPAPRLVPASEPSTGETDGAEPATAAEDPTADWFERLGVALGELRGRLGPLPEICITALPASRVTIRQITLPFIKQREIELVVGQEVEEYVPFRDLDQIFFDHLILEQHNGVSQLQIAVCEKQFLQRFLEVLQQHGLDPRIVSGGGLSKATLVRTLLGDSLPPVAVVDVGHGETTVSVIVAGKTMLWRNQLRGGQQLVERVAQAYDVSRTVARQVIQQELEILSPEVTAEYHPDRRRLSDLARETALRIQRTVKQVLLAFSGIHDQEVKEVYLCGGASLIPGLARLLSDQLGVPVRTFDFSHAEWLARIGSTEAVAARAAEALSLALSGLPQARNEEINFRKGPLAFQGGYQYVHGKVLGAAVVICLLILGLGFFAFAKARDLTAQEQALIADTKARTQVLLGTQLVDPETIQTRMRRTEPGGKREGIPARSAYDLFHEVSQVIPTEVQVDLETLEIDLDRRRAEIRGKTTTATAVEEIVEALNKIQCFQGGIEKEKNEKISSESKQLFVLNVKLGC